MDARSRYLLLPQFPSGPLAGLRWSSNGEAVEHEDGRTFILASQLAPFIEGYGSRGRLPSFVTLVHLLPLLGFGRTLSEISREEGPGSLARMFEDAGWPLRNAGALMAEVARHVPAVPEAIDPDALGRRLRSPALMAEMASYLLFPNLTWLSLTHTLEVQETVKHVRDLFAVMPEEELRYWLKHGCPPVTSAGEEIAQVVPPPPPRTLAHVLADLAQRPRLAAAVPFVAQLVSALALPPRRLTHTQIPTGGYADVTTRGQPEQILPGQLALDSLEFVRRFSQNELLFYRREEPHSSVREELILLLDQGVRTWGTVRLVLTAAALALGKRAERGKLALRLGATGNDGQLIDPIEATPDELAAVVEASDLSLHPGLALERVLDQIAATDDEVVRDVVLLTQRRNVNEKDVAAAARRVSEGVRLFTVAVEDTGEGELCELRRGHAVKVRSFRIDLSVAEPQPCETPHVHVEAPRPWTGDVEPIGFPFLIGPLSRKPEEHYFDFDHDAEWVLESGPGGTLHAWRVDGTAAEVLPRGRVGMNVLRDVGPVIGVRGGFAVVGLVKTELVLCHYDFTSRRCRSFSMGQQPETSWQWYYLPDLHLVAAKVNDKYLGFELARGFALEVTPEDRASLPEPNEWIDQLDRAKLTRPLPVMANMRAKIYPQWVQSKDGSLCITFADGTEWGPFIPKRDGMPLLETHRIREVWLHHRVLLLQVMADGDHQNTMHLFRVPGLQPLGEISVSARGGLWFTVSRDGRWLARVTSRGRIEVRELGGNLVRRDPFPTSPANNRVAVQLGECWITAQSFGHSHLVSWRNGQWLHASNHQTSSDLVRDYLVPQGGSNHTPPYSGARPHDLFVDNERWIDGANANLEILFDVYGHIVLRKYSGPVVAMFLVRGAQLAAWTPQGVRYGPASLLGGPPTPGVGDRLGPMLYHAWTHPEETDS